MNKIVIDMDEIEKETIDYLIDHMGETMTISDIIINIIKTTITDTLENVISMSEHEERLDKYRDLITEKIKIENYVKNCNCCAHDILMDGTCEYCENQKLYLNYLENNYKKLENI